MLPRIADYDVVDVRLPQIIKPVRPGSFFKGDAQITSQPDKKLQNGAGLGFRRAGDCGIRTCPVPIKLTKLGAWMENQTSKQDARLNNRTICWTRNWMLIFSLAEQLVQSGGSGGGTIPSSAANLLLLLRSGYC
jgi:hypothetical protein